MKLRVFAEKENNNRPIYLKLVPNNDGSVTLQAVDKYGDEYPDGSLLTIYSDKEVRRLLCVNSNFGFMLDGVGRLMIEN